MAEHLLLLDASGFIHRAYHRGGGQYRASDGMPTWAITGFMGMFFRLLRDAQSDPPTLGAAVFDAPGKNWRHEIFPKYKRNRPARDLELSVQLPYMRPAAMALGIQAVELDGYEADDVIATLATKARKAGIRTTIVSSDKDFCQLVEDGSVEIVDPMANIRILEADVRNPDKFGVAPRFVPEVQALAGDAVDNIPGLDGIGIKTAAGLIRHYKSIEKVLDAAHGKTNGYMTGRLRSQLVRNGSNLALYRRLATLRKNAPVRTDIMTLRMEPIYQEGIDRILAELQVPKDRREIVFGQNLRHARIVEAIKGDPLAWWSDELAGRHLKTDRLPDTPQCGFYTRALVRGGVFVPARIFREPEIDVVTNEPSGRDILKCEVNGRACDPLDQWYALALKPISEFDYRHEMKDFEWCRLYAPNDPKANPRVKVDHASLPPPVFDTKEPTQATRKKRKAKR